MLGEPGVSIHPGIPLGPRGGGWAITCGPFTLSGDVSPPRTEFIGDEISFPEMVDARGFGRLFWRREEADAIWVKVERVVNECASVMVEIESLRFTALSPPPLR